VALSEIVFSIETGGLGRPLPGKDHYSGLVTFIANANLPAGFTTGDRIKQIGSLTDAESLGIVSTSAVDGIKILHYTIKRIFGKNPRCVLWVGLYDTATIDVTVVKNVQNFANGECRQIAVLNYGTELLAAQVTALQAVAVDMLNEYAPALILYAAKTATTAITSLPDLAVLTAPYVSTIVGQDGAGEGDALATSLSLSVPAIGDLLGQVSRAKVHESIAWVAKFPLVAGGTGGDANDLDDPAFGNGTKVSATALSTLEAIENKGYIFVRKYRGQSNSYFNKFPTCVAASNDLSKGYAVRSIFKAIRNSRAQLLPLLSAPVYLNADGKLSPESVDLFRESSNVALRQMVADGELSAAQTLVDPDQNVAATSEVATAIELVPVGTAERITVKIGYVVALTRG
jgi:hypothetical protein